MGAWIAAGVVGLGLGYVAYKAIQAVTHAQEREAAKEEGLHDAGTSHPDGGAPVQ